MARAGEHSAIFFCNASGLPESSAVAFYAASAGSNGGSYRIDNVSVRYAPGGSTTETLCDDPLAPAPTGGLDSETMLVNGDFGWAP